MSKQLELTAEERTILGKQVKQIRRKGFVPANLFGHNAKSTSLQINRVELQKVLSLGGANSILRLKVGPQPPVQALIKHVQRHPTGGDILHLDLYLIAASEKLRTHVPLRFVGEPTATHMGDASVMRALNDVLVECFPAKLPASVVVDLSLLSDVATAIHVGDLDAGPDAAILNDHRELVASLLPSAKREVEETEEKAP